MDGEYADDADDEDTDAAIVWLLSEYAFSVLSNCVRAGRPGGDRLRLTGLIAVAMRRVDSSARRRKHVAGPSVRESAALHPAVMPLCPTQLGRPRGVREAGLWLRQRCPVGLCAVPDTYMLC
ncbi:hypothetical protein DL89DRAFT_256856 [Linderina pennispora]|uniref:Uncharacterized protein n=1 Tax=Linderina pennispora TaxID=61395 RepID=A0A1Y1WAV5_9FUNG|nr:uncharacterized protein DL89DRAFT_256856 [Linderina pennispora]ORX70663.1 hypothetical protein DL89DRAFT_256856 [Linderina pennispora]